MKKIFLLLVCSFLMTSFVYAQKQATKGPLSVKLEAYLRQTSQQIKPYYAQLQTARTCEAWNSCAKWAAEQYKQNPSFKITKAQLITQRKVYRHNVTKETHLFVEATCANRILYLEFTTPNNNGRKRPYNYIIKFPK